MFKSFFVALSRSLWRNRLFTTLNIVGLSVSICIAWIVFRMVSYEYSYDKKIPEVGNVYQVVVKSKDADDPTERGFAGVALPVYNTLAHDVTGVQTVVPLFYKYHHKVVIAGKENTTPVQVEDLNKDITLVSTTPDYFNMLGYRWLAGNEATALDAPDKVVLTDQRAGIYFPSLSPQQMVGRTIVYDDTMTRQVSGVVAQLDYPNSFSAENNEFIPLLKDDLTDNEWGGMSSDNLVFIKPDKGANPQRIMDQLNVVNTKYNQENFEKYKYKTWYDVLPLSQKHFEAQYGAQTRTADKRVLKGLMLAGVFLLLLACINYMNLSTAQLPGRAREIGIRKTLGGSSRGLAFRFMGESLTLTFIAAVFALGLTAFAVKLFAGFLPDGLPGYVNYGGMALFLLSLIIAVAFLSGWYPAWLASRVNTVSVLKGVVQNGKGGRGILLRKGLIVFQFLIAQVFIIGSIVVHQQLKFALHKDLGFNKEGIVTVPIPYYVRNDPQYKDKQFVLKNELQHQAGIQGVSLGSRPMDNTMFGNIMIRYRDTTKVQSQINMKFADTDYLKLYGFKLLAGRNFVASDTMNELVINEKAVKAFGFSSPEEAIGQILVTPGNNKRYPVVGVVADFHQFGVRSKIDPALITTSKGSGSAILNIKLPSGTSRWKASIAAIEKEWKKLYAGVPFQYSFYDETVKKFYQQEERAQTLVSTATGIAVLISCLGLFGLATLMAYQRVKEIGIRKVLGASVLGIVRLLSKEFLSLVFISAVIASPIAWWMMNKWLQDYAYKIEIRWWVFLFAILAACVTALLTVGYQAIKAARANPAKSLRTE